MKLRHLKMGNGFVQTSAFILAASTLVALACHQARPLVTAAEPQEAERPECPQDSVLIPVRDSLGYLTGETIRTIPLSGPITDIREFHDCQAFISPDSQYLSLFAVFAAYRRDSFAPLRDSIESLRTKVEGMSSREGTGQAQAATGVPYATIYNYGTVPYAPLGIEPGFSCLYMWRDAKNGRWRARMVARGRAEPDCSALYPQILDPTSGKELLVQSFSPRTSTGKPFRLQDYPPVARWDWDSRNSKQYVDIMCGTAWCEVGDSDLVPSPVHPPAHGWKPAPPVPGMPVDEYEIDRVGRIKLWHDEQRLALPSPTGQLRPGRVWGAIFPNPALGRLDSTKTYRRRWIPVATTFLLGPDADQYRPKLGMARGISRIAFCYGPWNSCPHPSGVAAPCGLAATGDHWFARISTAALRQTFRCVIRRVYNVTIPGTARWRWSTSDETTWSRCPTGCCEIY